MVNTPNKVADGDAPPIDGAQEVLARMGVPFAKALAVFMAEYERAREGATATDNEGRSGHPAPRSRPRAVVTDEDRERAARVDALEARGELEKLSLSDIKPERLVAARVRQVLKEKDMTQAQLAHRLGVNPSVISRVLARPEKAKIQTLRNLADALEIELYEVI